MSSQFGRAKLQLVERLRRTEALKRYEVYKRSEWFTPEQILDIQLDKIRKLLKHAQAQVPYYRDIFLQAGVQPDDIKTVRDYQRLPLLTKDTVRQNGDQMLARNRAVFAPHRKATGGSTGHPLTYYMDRQSRSAQWAHIYRLWHTAGWQPGEKMVMLGGSSLYPSSDAIKKWFYVKLNNWLPLSAFGMSPVKMLAWTEQLRKFKARFMHAYASSAYLFAKFLQENAIQDIRFDAVFTTAEMLQPKFRTLIEQVFGCKVFDFYGAADGGAFAFECEAHLGLHCVSESCFIEIVNETGDAAAPGEIGEVVTTDLNNHAMPFIRYRLGDKGMFAEAPCSCGRGLPVLQKVIGRTPDFIESKTGERYHEEFFSYLFKEVDWISQFCVVQKSRDQLDVFLKADTQPTASELVRLQDFLSKKFKGMTLQFKLSEELPVSASGKYKYIINKT